MRHPQGREADRWAPRLCVALCSAFFVLAAAAHPPLPEGVPGERARAMVAILTGPAEDAAAIEPIVTANWAASALAQRPAGERAKALAGVRVDLGSAQLVRVEPRGENELTLTFHSPEKGLWLEVGMKLDPHPPRGILAASMRLDSNPPVDVAASGQSLSTAQALARAAARIEELAASDAFSGVVLIARDGETLLEKAAGMADRERAIPNTVATRFNIGSISKAFTQVLIAQLATQGKLALDDRLVRHLPDYPDRDVAEKITLRQLLDHRSGLGDIFNERFTPDAAAGLRTLSDYLQLFTGQPLQFEPGTDQRYSNAGYIVLGLVVERITNKSFAEAAHERIFLPAGMSASNWLRRDALPRDAATGYTRPGWQERGGLQAPRSATPDSPAAFHQPRFANSSELPAIGSSAGGSYSTARDLLAFDRALATNRLGDPEQREPRGGSGIAGGTVGANAALESDWESGWTIIVLENIDPPAAEQLTREIRALVTRVSSAERVKPGQGS